MASMSETQNGECHHPARQPIGPIASNTTAIAARAAANSGASRNNNSPVPNEVVAIVIVVAPDGPGGRKRAPYRSAAIHSCPVNLPSSDCYRRH